MLTILEGPDGGGKSTFASFLASRGAFHVHDHGPYKGETNIAPKYFNSIVEARSWPIIMDRSWVAEPIYGAAFRGGTDRIGTARRRMLERAAYSVRGVVALFMPPYDVCRRTFLARLDQEYLETPTELANVYDGYLGLVRGVFDVSGEAYAAPHGLPYVVADWTRHTPQAIAMMIEAARPAANRGPGSGHWWPDESILIVGDRNDAGDFASEVSPFTSWVEDGHGSWLAETLEEAGIPERRLYWINSHDHHGRPASSEWINELRPRSVVCLGKEAAQWFFAWTGAKYMGSVHEVQHPKYWKTHHSDELYPLIDAIQESLR